MRSSGVSRRYLRDVTGWAEHPLDSFICFQQISQYCSLEFKKIFYPLRFSPQLQKFSNKRRSRRHVFTQINDTDQRRNNLHLNNIILTTSKIRRLSLLFTMVRGWFLYQWKIIEFNKFSIGIPSWTCFEKSEFEPWMNFDFFYQTLHWSFLIWFYNSSSKSRKL